MKKKPGFLIQARAANKQQKDLIGSFVNPPSGSQSLRCFNVEVQYLI